MYKRAATLALTIAGAVFAQELHLKTRTIRLDSSAAAATQPESRPGIHLIVQFDHFPSVGDLDGLLTDGNTAVSVVPDNAVMVTTQTGSVTARSGVRWIWGRIFRPGDIAGRPKSRRPASPRSACRSTAPWPERRWKIAAIPIPAG